MVSTRGVKFKFSEGEKVLCYEPDTTKAKVLYDSKVLGLVVSRDSRGRKVPEYLIHFSGWNSSWDRCVVEDFILPDNEENRNLQRRLAEDAALQLKGKHKRKLPPIIKETLTKKECTEAKKEMDSPEHEESPNYNSESESAEEEVERPNEIEIPHSLKRQLEEDYYCITKKNKVVKIPCEPNVVSILESYVKHLAADLLCVSPVKNSKMRNEPRIPEDVESKLDFCKEVMDGIRVYFDFTLPHLLLYQQEQKQYYTVGKVCKPISGIKREAPKSQNESTPLKDSTAGAPSTAADDENSQIEQDKSKPNSPISTTHVPTPTRGRPSLRNSHTLKSEGRGRREKVTGPKRILRSNDKLKAVETFNVQTDVTKKISADVECSLSTRSESPVQPGSPSHLARGSIKGTTNDLLQSVSVSSSDVPLSPSHPSQCFSNLASSTASSISSSSQCMTLPPALNLSITNSIYSSASSTHSSSSSPRFDDPPFPPLTASGILSEILSWNMLPLYIYKQVPSPPSLIYGAQHLLRLFVKLPGLIYKMNIPRKKLIPLIHNLADFLNYLSERREEIFLSSAYVDANETSEQSSSYTSA